MSEPDSSTASGLPADLKLRAISGTVLVLVAAVELYLGGSYLIVFIAVLAAGMIWEALNLTGVQGKLRRILATAMAALGLLLLMPDLPNGGFPVWVALLPMLGTLVFAWAAATRKRAFPLGMVAAASVCLGCLAVVLADLRADTYVVPPLVLLVPAVIGTDIGAYFTGRRFGGPKLAPRISPNKTWSGAIGGVFFAVILGLSTLWLLVGGVAFRTMIYAVGALVVLSACSQIGDLVESWLKRRAGQKDSGRLIPGHGGLLDRFDGFLGASVLGLGPWLVFQEIGG